MSARCATFSLCVLSGNSFSRACTEPAECKAHDLSRRIATSLPDAASPCEKSRSKPARPIICYSSTAEPWALWKPKRSEQRFRPSPINLPATLPACQICLPLEPPGRFRSLMNPPESKRSSANREIPTVAPGVSLLSIVPQHSPNGRKKWIRSEPA